MVQSPMLSSPLKQTNEIDWIQPLKDYIRQTYGEDPERYSQECATLNRLRQDMRGAGKDSATGRDLLYRYYGQLELLDLRFPVDENHIKISFTWYVRHLSASHRAWKLIRNYLLGTMLSPINPLPSTRSPSRKLPSSSTSPPSFPAMPPTKTDPTTPVSRRHTTPSRPPRGCLHTSTRTSYTLPRPI